MSEFVADYLDPMSSLKILDAGSYNVNGSYKSLFKNWQYSGLDVEPGPNVDIVVNGYDWGINEEYDVVISGQALEHVEDMSKFMKAIYLAVKPGGLVCIIAPGVNKRGKTFKRHRYPIDCWRILPDGMKFLLDDFDIIKIWRRDMDCIGIAKKP